MTSRQFRSGAARKIIQALPMAPESVKLVEAPEPARSGVSPVTN